MMETKQYIRQIRQEARDRVDREQMRRTILEEILSLRNIHTGRLPDYSVGNLTQILRDYAEWMNGGLGSLSASQQLYIVRRELEQMRAEGIVERLTGLNWDGRECWTYSLREKQ